MQSIVKRTLFVAAFVASQLVNASHGVAASPTAPQVAAAGPSTTTVR